MNVIIGPTMGEVSRDGKIIGKQYMVWCNGHPFIMDNEEQPSPRDIKKINETIMKLTHTKDKKGNIEAFYSCPKCGQTVKAADVDWEVQRGRN